MRFRAGVRNIWLWPARGGLGSRLTSVAFSSGIIRLAGTVFGFAIGVILTRALGPSGYGVYALVMAITGPLIACSQMGLPQLATREVPVAEAKSKPAETKGVIYASVSVIVLAGLVIMVAGFFWLRFLHSGDRVFEEAMAWGFALVPLFAITNIGASILLGLNRPVLYLCFEGLARPAFFAVTLAIIWTASVALTPQYALAAHVAVAAGVLVACLAALLLLMPAEVRRAPKAEFRPGPWAASAVVMFATEIVRVLDGNSGVFVVQAFNTTEAVGLFRAAEAAAAFLWLPMALLTTIVMPVAATLNASGDLVRLQKLAAGSAAALSAFSLAVLVVIAFAGEWLVVLAFGPEFRESYGVLLLFGLAAATGAFFGTGSAILNMVGEERTVVRAFAVALAVKVVGALILTGPFGIHGVPLAAIAAEAVKGLIVRKRAQRRLGIDIAATTLLRAVPSSAGFRP